MDIKCVQCNEVKELTSDNFYTRKGVFDTSRCKLCYRKYQSAGNRRKRLMPASIDTKVVAELQCSICRTKKPGTRIFFRNIEDKTSIICWNCWDFRPIREQKEPTNSGEKLLRGIIKGLAEGKITLGRKLDEIGIIVKR